ncbi:MAG: hypothetical protein P8X74_09500 [Reinekea sp.]
MASICFSKIAGSKGSPDFWEAMRNQWLEHYAAMELRIQVKTNREQCRGFSDNKLLL